MQINGVPIEDTFAEAFPMWAARIIITAQTAAWALEAARQVTGMATSIIGCGIEAGIEKTLTDTPDGRPGISVLFFTTKRDRLAKSLVDRIGQCIMTCPTTACFDGLAGGEIVRAGRTLSFFGDGFQCARQLDGVRYCRVPVMDGEFLVADSFHIQKGVGGGNFIVMGTGQRAALAAAERAVAAIAGTTGVILPFPGGIVRSGSKVGSRYKGLVASTNHRYCPTLRARTDTALPPGVNAVYEVVLDGLSVPAVAGAMVAGIGAASRAPGVALITAGNYGGKLGPYHLHLHELLAAAPEGRV